MLPQIQFLEAVLREEVPELGLGTLGTIAEIEDPVLVVGQAGVDGYPLDPGFECLLLLLGIGHIYLRLVVESLEVREVSLPHGLMDQGRREFVELQHHHRTGDRVSPAGSVGTARIQLGSAREGLLYSMLPDGPMHGSATRQAGFDGHVAGNPHGFAAQGALVLRNGQGHSVPGPAHRRITRHDSLPVDAVVAPPSPRAVRDAGQSAQRHLLQLLHRTGRRIRRRVRPGPRRRGGDQPVGEGRQGPSASTRTRG